MALKAQKINTCINDRVLSVIVFALFFAWLLAFPFEGQILYSITDSFGIEPDNLIFGAIALHFAGLLASGFIIKSARAAKKLMLATLVYCFLCSGAFLMILDRSAPSYLVVDTLMLGACGVYDLFWWSILGEMLDFDKNPAKVLGVGLSANVLGVLMGGMIGNAIGAGSNSATLVALAVVCVSLSILPLLHKRLSVLLKDHAYLTTLSEMSPREQSTALHCVAALSQLTGREREVAELLLKGKNYKTIAYELHISDNTTKSHIKNIYSKLKIHNRTELIKVILEKRSS